jgi:phosphoribosylformylglycinamidine synthase subunit PurQ / glutaminase
LPARQNGDAFISNERIAVLGFHGASKRPNDKKSTEFRTPQTRRFPPARTPAIIKPPQELLRDEIWFRRMKLGVVVFPGSNCDHDAFYALGEVLRQPVEFIWHQSEDLSGFDAVVLPGGFSYGDYLRTGAIARFSPVMRAVERFAQSGGLVLGICNGFQILCEAGLLPGALMRNRGLRFICRHVHVRVESVATPFTSSAVPGQVLRIPIAHADGNYFCDDATLADLQRNDQIVFRYCAPDARIDPAANPNGSLDAIAGVCNRERNVLGLMPHPERAAESILGSTGGLVLLRSLVASLARPTAAVS